MNRVEKFYSGWVVEMGSPRELVERYECVDLDEVFIYLARREDDD